MSRYFLILSHSHLPRSNKGFPQSRKIGGLFHPWNFLFLTWVVAVVKSFVFFFYYFFNFYGICSFVETVDKIWPSLGSCLLLLGQNLPELLARHISFMRLQTVWSSLVASPLFIFTEDSNLIHRLNMLCLQSKYFIFCLCHHNNQ